MQRLGAVRHGVWGIMLIVGLVVQCLLVGAFVAHDRALRRRELALMSFSQNPDAWLVENESTPIVRPSVLAASAAHLRADELVVGVEAGGHPRAYVLSSLDDPRRHVVNDLVGSVPVSVVYCNLNRCLRVYTDSNGSSPLDVRVAGLFNGEMVVRLRGILYLQNSGAAVDAAKTPASTPYALMPLTLATWSEWVARHPDTDVYDGQ